MTTSHRRFAHLLACLAGAATAIATFAGPLNPPAGPVTSSHKTLTEVEPRIVINATIAACMTASATAQQIDDANKLAWGDNVGFINWADAPAPATPFIDAGFLSGFIWAENVGWINLDDDTIFFVGIGSLCPDCAADYDGNGGVDGGDLAFFFTVFEAGGC